MVDERILRELASKENNSLEILLASRASKASLNLNEFIEFSLAQGVSRDQIRDLLVTDLNTGGAIFGDFRRSLRTTANGTINRLRDGGQFSESGVETTYKWAAVFVNTCPDCESRHGVEHTWEEWERLGLPRTGQTICRENCRCMLIPSEHSVLKPIKIDARN